ncbi:MAG: NAD(P)/FAD-dependent oxidoreductase [Chloroflexi bacterium]|nr:NAD(P)/FAD-dependent oxidoreductase [Chloroflexota bacterium]MCI0787315.1 NAD(P)/FAD-dependent oxidoreductase [Chloroflexota bacterium]MCI0793212.1 NAD(P)/FAD-dependent oxidoreductase [Chloroflexota bacterium]MCI0797531.1 NAD(P)/FAD-dependent oxidoreductase [Chloroflexota bacterium]MCI0825975.1 NAD(P)/FAD-dependent oxidoreductase [Chloroflexota bacterium]
MRVGIIGGGAAGLAAAYELVKQGHYAEVFERAPFLGGQASTFEVGGGQLEKGYHHLFVSDVDMVALIHELGLGDKLAWLESKVGLFHGGKVWDFSTPMDLLRFRPLSLLQRIRVGWWTFVLQKTRNWQKFEGITARDWISQHMGRRVYEVIWEPLLRGKFGEYYDQVSMTWLWGKIYLRVASRGKGLQKERLGYPMGSFGEVFDVLGDSIRRQGGDIHISAGVDRVVVGDDGATGLEVTLSGQEPETREYDAVIATTPSYIFTRLVPTLPDDYREKLVNVQYLSAVLVILVLDRPLSDKYWINIADANMPFVGIIEHTNMIDKSLYGGKHIVYLSNYPSRDSELYQKSGEELVEEFIPYLRQINPDFDRSWILEHYHHKVDGAQPIIGVNYSQRMPAHRTPIKNLYLANTTQIYPEDRGTNYSVRMGRQVARMVMEDAAAD